MGTSSSKPGQEESVALRELLSPRGGAHPAQQLYFGKQTSCLDMYNVCEATSGRRVYLVKSDLSAAREERGRTKTTSIYVAANGGDTDAVGEIVCISALASGSACWNVEVTLNGAKIPCNVKTLSRRGRTRMMMVLGKGVSSDSEDVHSIWQLVGDKSRQSSVITAPDGRLIAHIERHSRNTSQHFYNPHAYLLTTASEANIVLVVAFCICLDKVENRSREKGYAREVQRARSKGVRVMSGYHDADGFGSACF